MVRKITSQQSPFITKILNELVELRGRVEKLESALETSENATINDTGDVAEAKIRALSAVSAIAVARRAIYGYSMLLNEMGLPKHQAQLIKQMEQGVSMALRLIQTYQMLKIQAMTTYAAMGPIGWAMLGIGVGGTAISAVMYGSRALGG